ncbi:MAG: response regulator [Bacteroidetes bacterium]|nr:response regulator [Bacteroidota bacterium]HET6245925.1 response regulator [Bacteroidia bacterium]
MKKSIPLIFLVVPGLFLAMAIMACISSLLSPTLTQVIKAISGMAFFSIAVTVILFSLKNTRKELKFEALGSQNKKENPEKENFSSKEYPKQIESELSRIKVLVVDSDTFNRFLLSAILQQNNASVDEASSNWEAKNLVRANNFDLILLDFEMIDRHVEEWVKELRGDQTEVDLPVIVIAKNASVQEVQAYILRGINAYLLRPVNEINLIEKINLVLENKQKNRNTGKAELGKDTISEHELYDLSELKKITKGDAVFFKKIIELFIENTPDTIEKIKTATKENQWEQVSMLAHKMRPSFSHMGIKDMAEVLKIVEENAGENRHLDELPALLDVFYRKTEKVIRRLKKVID